MSDIVNQLLSNPGLYTGTQADPTASHPSGSVARVLVTPLPGGVGVSLDYEVLSPENGRVHQEHSVLARTPAGIVMTVAHSHADMASVLHEAEPGYFPARDGESTFPMAIRLEAPAPGKLTCSWSYGSPGEQLVVRDVGTMTLV